MVLIRPERPGENGKNPHGKGNEEPLFLFIGGMDDDGEKDDERGISNQKGHAHGEAQQKDHGAGLGLSSPLIEQVAEHDEGNCRKVPQDIHGIRVDHGAGEDQEGSQKAKQRPKSLLQKEEGGYNQYKGGQQRPKIHPLFAKKEEGGNEKRKSRGHVTGLVVEPVGMLTIEGPSKGRI